MTQTMSVQNSVVVAFLLLTLAYRLSAYPAYMYWDNYQAESGPKPQEAVSLNSCRNKGLCEMCAKFTKNEVIYAWCCENKKKTEKFCYDLLNYTVEK